MVGHIGTGTALDGPATIAAPTIIRVGPDGHQRRV